jgi:alpha-mannosidase
VEPNLDAIRAGLEQFVARATADQFSTSRLQQHYALHFSHEVMAARWREMMANPKQFFSTHA